MTREQFMYKLECLLWNIPENDRLDAIAYYNDYFDEAGKEHEAQVMAELGSPEKVAATIKGEAFRDEWNLQNTSSETFYQTSDSAFHAGSSRADWKSAQGSGQKPVLRQKSAKNISWPVVVILLILASPILIGLAAGIFGVTVGILAAAFGVVAAIVGCAIGFFVGGAVCLVSGIVRIFTSPIEGIVVIGIGALLLSLGLLLAVLFAWMAFRWIPALLRVLAAGCKRVYAYFVGERRRMQ